MGLGSLTCFLFRTWYEGPISSVKPCRCMLLSFDTFSCAAFPLHFLFWLPVVFSPREPCFLILSSLKGFDSLGWFSPCLFGCLPYPSLISQQNTPPPHTHTVFALHSSPLVPTLMSWCARRSDYTAAFDIFSFLFSASLSVAFMPFCFCLPVYLSVFFHWESHDGTLQEGSPNGAKIFITLLQNSYINVHPHITTGNVWGQILYIHSNC